jgi:sugar lactone lactonase YvrE
VWIIVAMSLIGSGHAHAQAQSQTITFPLPSTVIYRPGLTVPLTATASSGLPVTYTVPGRGGFSGSILPLNQAGPVSVTANQSGGTINGVTYAAATPVTHIVTGIQGPGSGLITALIGNGVQGFVDNTGAASAEFYMPADAVFDSNGNLYIADCNNNRIRKVIAPLHGLITASSQVVTVAGNGTAGYTGDNGPATAAQLNCPDSIAIDSNNNLYFGQSLNSVVREIVAATGNVITVAGNGQPGYSGDLGPATAAKINRPDGVAVDSLGNLYIADTANNRIRKVSGGNISTFAGNGTAGFSGDGDSADEAELRTPTRVFIDSSDNLYISDFGNQRIREISSQAIRIHGAVTYRIGTVLGNSATTGAACATNNTSARTLPVCAVLTAMDSAGNFYLADAYNNFVSVVAADTGILTTIAGNGTAGPSGNNIAATVSPLNQPTTVLRDSAGNIYIVGHHDNRISRVSYGPIAQMISFNQPSVFYTQSLLAPLVPYSFPVSATASSGLPVTYSISGRATMSGSTVSVAPGSIGSVTVTVNQNGGTVGGATYMSASAKQTFTISPPISPLNGPIGVGIPQGGPAGVAVDSANNVYIDDVYNQRILVEKISASGYTQFTLGTGLSYPYGIAVDSARNVYISDTSNNRVLKETLSSDGTSYTQCVVASGLSNPYGVAVDGSFNVYIADRGNNRILKETPLSSSDCSYSQNIVLTGLSLPFGVAVDGSSNLYVSSGSQVLKETLSGGTYTASPLYTANPDTPQGIALDNAGDLYIAGGSGHVFKETFSGGGYTQSIVADNSPANTLAVAVGGNGSVYIDDQYNLGILIVIGQTITLPVLPSFTYPVTQPYPLTAATASSGLPVTYAFNSGPATLNTTPTGSTLTITGAGTISLTVSQAGGINPATGATYAALSVPLNITVGQQTPGLNLAPVPTKTYGNTSSFSASLSWTGAGAVPSVPSGAVTFTVDGGTPQAAICPANPTTSPITCTLSVLVSPIAGTTTHTLTATYAGDANYSSLTTLAAQFIVNQQTPGVALTNVPEVTYGSNSSLSGSLNWNGVGAVPPTGAILFTGGVAGTPGPSLPETCSPNPTTSPITCTYSGLFTGGTHLFGMRYPGDINYASSQNGAYFTVDKQAPALTVSSVATARYGNSTLLNASLAWTGIGTAPTGAVTFKVDSIATPPGISLPATCSSTTRPMTCTYTGIFNGGQHDLNVIYAGDGNYSSAATSAPNFTVNTATPALVLNSGPVVTYGTASLLSVSLAWTGPVPPTNGVTFTVGTGGTPMAATCPVNPTTSPIVCTLSVSETPGTYTLTASYAGDSNYSAATSASGSFSVSQQAPQLTPASASTVYGSNSILTASLVWTGSGSAPTGPVTFIVDNGSPLTATCSGATSPLLCTYNGSSFSGGSHTLNTNYSGDSNYIGHTTQTNFNISTSMPVLTLGSVGTVTYGSNSTLSASLAWTGTAAPTGGVTFTVDGSTQHMASCSGTTSPLTCTTNTNGFGGGSHTLNASYIGDSNYSSVVAASSATFSVNKGAPVLTLSSVGTVTYGSNSSLSASLTWTGTTAPTGGVTFTVDGTPLPITSCSGNTTLTCTYNSSGFGGGSHTLSVSYVGDSNYSGVTAPSATFNVSQQPPSLTLSSVAPETYGTASSLSASLTWTGSAVPAGGVTFTVDGGTPRSSTCATTPTTSALTCTLSVLVSPIPGTTTHTLTATYAGDSNYSALTTPSAQFTVNQQSPGLTSASVPAVTYGTASSLSASLSWTGTGAAPAGAITFIVDGATATPLTATCPASRTTSPVICTYTGIFTGTTGTGVVAHTLSASYAGDSNYSAVTTMVPATFNVSQQAPGMTLSSVATKTYGNTSSLSASLTWTGSGSAPAGAVTFIVDSGAPLTATCTGTASPFLCTYTGIFGAVPPHTLHVSYAGDSNYSGATVASTTPFSVTQATTALTLNSVTAVTYGSNSTLSASLAWTGLGATPTGGVIFTVDGGTPLPVASCSGTASPLTCTYNGPFSGTGPIGTTPGVPHTLSASYAGDSNYTGATTAQSSFNVNPASQSLTAAIGTFNPIYGVAYPLSGTATSGLPVTYQDAGTCGGAMPEAPHSLNGNMLTLNGDGYVCILAYQNGNADYLAAPGNVVILVWLNGTPLAPVLISPGDSTSPGPLLLTTTPTTLSWNPVAFATGYKLFVEDMNISLVIASGPIGNVTSYTLPAGALYSGHAYKWNLSAIGNPATSATSTSLYFQGQ